MDRSRESAAQERLLRLATNASVGVAFALIVVKLAAWLQSGSVSLLASLLDSLLDSMASLLNLVAVRYALAPADAEHRFGHGKAEPLAALVQALLILGSCAVVFYEAISRLITPRDIEAVGAAVAVMVFSIAATLALILFQRHVIRRTQSPAIRADSLHYQADLLTNSATIAALVLAGLGLPIADPLFGLGIALWLLFTTREVLLGALDQLLDRELPDEEREAILGTAADVAGADAGCFLRTRRSGRTRHIQIHLTLDGALSLTEAHGIANAVKGGILARFPEADVLVYPRPSLTHPPGAGDDDKP